MCMSREKYCIPHDTTNVILDHFEKSNVSVTIL